MKETSKIILSGEYSRRRGYLTNFIASLNALAIMGTISIWGIFIRWDLLYGEAQNYNIFAIQLAWASCLSSVLLGLWRFYVHYLDASIIRLYPALYLCELEIIPKEITSIYPPKNVTHLTKELVSQGIDWKDVRNVDFGHRGHRFLDWVATLFIIAFALISVFIAYNFEIIRLSLRGCPHLIGLLLFGNVIGLLLILLGWLLWRRKKVKWPIPKSAE